jgi:hypothetical protein
MKKREWIAVVVTGILGAIMIIIKIGIVYGG